MAAARKRATVSLADAITDEVADQQAARPAPVPAPEPAAAPERRLQPPEQPRTAPAWDARMSLTLSRPMKKALDIARAEDGIEGTARIRAMIALWESDERLRRRIDKMARDYR